MRSSRPLSQFNILSQFNVLSQSVNVLSISVNVVHSMSGERESDKYSAFIDVTLKKCFERVTETLKDSLIEVMSTVKDILAEAIRCEMEALKNEQLIEVKKCKEKKVNGSKRQAKVSKMNFKKQTKGLLKSDNEVATMENKVLVDAIDTNSVLKTENVSTFTRDLVPPLEDIQPVVLYDSNITVER
ncbi:hypothetical protein ACOME3_007057 [Neoechinorhynchus agilis]